MVPKIAGPKLHELLLEAKLTSKKHVIVEGNSDERFFLAWLQHVDNGKNVVVTSMDRLVVPTADVLDMGLHDGNRGRVILAAREAAEKGIDLRCIADRDCGHHVGKHCYVTLLWTDYPALESYAADAATLEKANLLSFGGKLPAGEQLLPALSFALRELYAVRKHHENLPRPQYEKGLTGKSRNLEKFDVTQTLDKSVRPHVGTYSRPSDSDARKYAYGHDIGELLLAAYANEIKNGAGLRKLEAVEGALRSAVQAVGAYVNEGLFVELRAWIIGR